MVNLRGQDVGVNVIAVAVDAVTVVNADAVTETWQSSGVDPIEIQFADHVVTTTLAFEANITLHYLWLSWLTFDEGSFQTR